MIVGPFHRTWVVVMGMFGESEGIRQRSHILQWVRPDGRRMIFRFPPELHTTGGTRRVVDVIVLIDFFKNLLVFVKNCVLFLGIVLVLLNNLVEFSGRPLRIL